MIEQTQFPFATKTETNASAGNNSGLLIAALFLAILVLGILAYHKMKSDTTQ